MRGYTLAELLFAIMIFIVVATLFASSVNDVDAIRAEAERFAVNNGAEPNSLLCAWDQQENELDCIFGKTSAKTVLPVKFECAQFGCADPYCVLD